MIKKLWAVSYVVMLEVYQCALGAKTSGCKTEIIDGQDKCVVVDDKSSQCGPTRHNQGQGGVEASRFEPRLIKIGTVIVNIYTRYDL